ncbi:hypothetical protein AWZ03_014192, partial [Drosophila navojoa]
MARLLQPLVASWLLWALLAAALIAGRGTEARGWNYR